MLFFKEILRVPAITGAIAPSSKHLARLVVEKAEVQSARCILELGPGTGVITREILRAKNPHAELVLLERNTEFVKDLSRTFPGLQVVSGCASELESHARTLGLPPVDCIVSGLPWALFGPRLRADILRSAHGLLAPGGMFATYTYFGPHFLPAGRALRSELETHFPQLNTTGAELRNLPPAFVYFSRKPPGGNGVQANGFAG